MSSVKNIKRLIETHNRNLQKLKEQQASFGLYTPTYILTEIEDIEVELRKLQTQLKVETRHSDLLVDTSTQSQTVRAEQLIFTRVEPTYSPQHKDGFQTVYKSKGLTSSEVKQIEKKIQCFQPKEPVDRQQFFMIDSGKVVLTHTALIEGHPEIIDRNKRRAFIAHALVFNQNELGKTDYNPFIIFDQIDLFIDNAETMIKEFGQATGIAEPVDITITEYEPRPSDWTSDELSKLVSLAEQAEGVQRNQKSLFLLGSEESIRQTLETVFFLVPSQQRLHCSFDTHIDRCPTSPGIYWAVGGTTRQSNSAFIQVLTQERRVEYIESPSVIKKFKSTLDRYSKIFSSTDGHKIICPYCLAEIRGKKHPEICPSCKVDLPVQYVHDYESVPPFFVQVFGHPGVGKTVFLSALTLMLRRMSNVWRGDTILLQQRNLP